MNHTMTHPRPRRCRSGSVLPLALVLLLVMMILGLAMFSLSSTSGTLSDSGYQKMRATASAEAGIHALYAQMASALDSVTTLPTSAAGALNSTINGVSTTDGSYSAMLTNTSVAGSVTTYSVQSTGTAPNGTTKSVIVSTFTSTMPAGGPFHFPDDSIISNGPIQLGNSHVYTLDDTNTNIASVAANGSVTLGNNAEIYGSVTTATTYSGGTVAGTVVTGTTTPFPSAATLAAWQASWLSTAKSGAQYSTCPPSGTTITAPAYINGDLSNSLNVKPCAGSSSIVYVNGNISGDVYVPSDGSPNDGVTIVCTGTFTSQNLLEANPPYTCTIVTLDTTTLDFSNSSRTTIDGVIYAANAGFALKNPRWTFDGSIIAGGTSGVSFGNGGGNATVHYPGNNLDSNSNSFTFAPQLSLLTNWVQTQ